MDERISSIISDMNAVAEDARSTFGSLSGTQLNWKPGEKSWSVAQCFDHLIVTHSQYLPELERLASGDESMTIWQRISPFSGFFGRFLIKTLDPKNTKKTRTTGRALPSSSEIGADIIERFYAHQSQMIDHLRSLPGGLDPAKMIVTSPLLGFVTYSLADTLTFIPMHCERHFGQAKRVMESEGFPT